MTRLIPTILLVVVLHAGCGTATGLRSSPSATDAGLRPTASAEPTATQSLQPAESLAATPIPNLQDGVASELGTFIGSWSSDPRVPPINALHEWVLHIETADGAPVEGATIVVGGDMPAHGHGMPTQPQVTEDLGGGNYRVEGMSFQMGGYWIIDVTVTVGNQTDRIHFGLEL
jgi:hypothetical protein